jgi:putative oxygen-independent coproporphyrinogen III oxidase
VSRRVIPIVSGQQPAAAATARAPGKLLSALPPLSLYVHVPWCVRKCPYCDFNSHQAPERIDEQAYLEALQQDLEQALPNIWGRQVHSIFIGGGTPSLLSQQAVDQMLGLFRAHLNLWPDAEITLEANPGAAEADRLKAYADSGVNRLSLGIQSFNDEALQALGRVHDAGQARRAIEMAMRAVERVNLDLMYGLPGQTVSQCRADLEAMVAFGTEHLSIYQLTLEPQTVFAKYPPVLPDELAIEQMEQAIEQVVEQAGWQRYEVSAYAKPSARCRHNLNYWTFGDYLGIGPGAHSKISFPDRIIRQARTRSPSQWMETAGRMDGSHIAQERELGVDELAFEFFLNALRLREGVDLDLFNRHTGLGLGDILEPIERARERGLLDFERQHIKATALGWRHLNELQAIFLK